MSPAGEDLDLSAVLAEVARLQQTEPRRACSVTGCDRKHYGQGLCKAHYMRQARTGSPGSAQVASRPRREPTCSVDGCGRPHQARGLCRTHYSRWKRTGEVQADTPPARRSCGVARCSRPHYWRGLCRIHYRRWKKAGDTQPAFDLAEAARLYGDGASATSLGRLFGLGPRAVLDRLRTAGVPIRPPGRQPHRLNTVQQPAELPAESTPPPPDSHQP